jgi:hypothetical protein
MTTPLAAPSAPVLFSRHRVPLLILAALTLLYWGRVLLTGETLLPGAMLRGFAPFSADPQAPWRILQWDALGQYYPWRAFAARQLHAGVLPLWNPHQFAGAPFVANLQSAVFYPLNFPFWLLDTTYAFGVSAAIHTLLAAAGTYFLAQRRRLSRAASLLAAIAFGFCGYLAAWALLPTLANTASWLPLLLLLLEGASAPKDNSPHSAFRVPHSAFLALALACALLAGHAQVFVYLVLALLLRALFLPQRKRAAGVLCFALPLSAALGAIQILPTLELTRLGHRAAQGGASAGGWAEIGKRALQVSELPSLLFPGWPMNWGTLNENFGYVGLAVALLALAGVLLPAPRESAPHYFAGALALFGLLYALATPLSQLFYFGVPGVSQMGGVGRALVLWSLGAALLAAFGLDALRRRWSTPVIPAVALIAVTGELFFTGWIAQPASPRATVYPRTALTDWLRERTKDGGRVLFLTPRERWLPTEVLQSSGVSHPPGVLPPNGAMVYGLHDVNGYDSLAPRAYREFVARGEGAAVSPPLNGNMILLNNPASPALDALNVRYVVSLQPLDDARLKEVAQLDGALVYQRDMAPARQVDGRDFYPGWSRDKKAYAPQSFRLGAFVSMCALSLLAAGAARRLKYTE